MLDTAVIDDLSWKARIVPLYDQDGQEVHRDIGRAVIRDDTGETIGIAGPQTQLIQHGDLLEPIFQELERNGFQLEERDPNRSFYDLEGKKGAWVTTSTAKNGAVLKVDIITGDLVRPTGRTNYLQRGPDTMLRRHRIVNSHNSSLAAQAHSDYLRLLCLNGMVSTSFSVKHKAKHTTGLGIEAFRRQVAAAAEMMERDAEQFGLYARTKLTPEMADEFLKRVFCKISQRNRGDESDDAYSEKLHGEIMQLFYKEDETVWGLVNALTAWATHGGLRAGAVDLTARLQRDEKVARAMRSREFNDMLVAA